MTRINCGIPVAELHNKHLMAEHREIKRIPNCIRKGRYSLKNQPNKFTLGTGHVKFFYDKLTYLQIRYSKLYDECMRREINVTSYHDAFNDLPVELCNDYTPTDVDREIVRERIKERLESMKN